MACVTMVTLPCAGSKSEIVSGMRSPCSSTRTMTNCPGCAECATRGARTCISQMPSARSLFSSIGYITIFFPAAALGAEAAYCRYSSMMAVTLSLRIGRSGSLVTIITKSVSTPKSCSPGSTDTLAVKELPAGMRCPGTSVVAILPLVSTARTTSSALPVFESVKVRSCLGAPCFTGPNLIIFSIICAFGAFCPPVPASARSMPMPWVTIAVPLVRPSTRTSRASRSVP